MRKIHEELSPDRFFQMTFSPENSRNTPAKENLYFTISNYVSHDTAGQICKTVMQLGKEVLDLTPKAQSIKGNTDKLDRIKVKNLLHEKSSKDKEKRITDWQKTSANVHMTKYQYIK